MRGARRLEITALGKGTRADSASRRRRVLRKLRIPAAAELIALAGGQDLGSGGTCTTCCAAGREPVGRDV